MKNVRSFTLAMILMISGVLSPCKAQLTDLPEAVTIDQLLEILREKSPKLTALRASIDVAASEVIGARVLPNPAISYGRYDHVGGDPTTRFNGSQQQQSTVNIPLLLAGQRAVRSEAAERGVSAAKAQVQASYAELARQTWQLFVKLLGWQERVRVLEDARSHLDRLKDIISGRAAAGTASQYEVLRINVEAVTLGTRPADAEPRSSTA